ncbi:hypothetical protein V500_06082 [Pseudogymnoascus sp. VKM F-4518 (FW-2643)]|nr:hypothetical protein V500_06082 [Pseudogymnoascus sp. VKM F-4518 (FW-2643)]
MRSHALKTPLPARAQGGNHIPLKQIRARGQGDRVAHAGLEERGLRGEEVEGFEDGGAVAVLQELDEGFDGGDGHG